ncbi:ATP-binding cassette domain-containing protein [Georgenia alba]|uniref:ATP-binding cassette domain-containing protein n=1 Tax=Georgenia alba TaxID=2233858 RepID=A0ABW2QDX7_9MICO
MPRPASDAPALQVADLRKSYGDREVLRGLSFDADRGRLTAVLGPNGVGKTTTIECCEGLRRPGGGTVEVLGHAVHRDGFDAALRARVGVMLQDGGLPLAPRAASVLAHVARLHRDPLDPASLLSRLGLTDVARTTVRRLSGGQRQRLALAAALVGRPELVFLDEPSAGLDVRARLAVWDLLRELRADGVSLVLTTHLMAEAEELADHVVVIDAGRVVAEGTPRELVGPDEVRVTVSPDDLSAVSAALDERLGRSWQVHPHRAWVSLVPAGSPDAGSLARVAQVLAEAGHPDAGVTSHRRTLEDAFLELTGHSFEGADR